MSTLESTTLLQDVVCISSALRRGYNTGEDVVVRASEYSDARAAITAVLTTPDVMAAMPSNETVVNAFYSIRGAHVADTQIQLPAPNGHGSTLVVVIDSDYRVDEFTLIPVIGSIGSDVRDLCEEADLFAQHTIFLLNEPAKKAK
jgi:hypothetical protein